MSWEFVELIVVALVVFISGRALAGRLSERNAVNLHKTADSEALVSTGDVSDNQEEAHAETVHLVKLKGKHAERYIQEGNTVRIGRNDQDFYHT